jgi:hypothetical protein
LICCIQTFVEEEEHRISTVPLSVFIPSTTTTIIHGQISKQIPSPTNSSSRSTVVRSQSSSSDIESPNEQILTKTLVSKEQLEGTIDEHINKQTNIQNEENNNDVFSQKG